MGCAGLGGQGGCVPEASQTVGAEVVASDTQAAGERDTWLPFGSQL